ncbi:MAG: MerR family transcriptional regulator [Gemmatimonadaceae bacterium]
MTPSALPAATAATATPRHPISVVVDRTGMSEHLLRMWERRHRAVEPARSDGGHRLYSDADIERVQLLHAATRAGRTIGQVAHLSADELARLVEDDSAARRSRSAVADAAATGAGLDGAHPAMEEALALTRSLDASALDGVLRRAAAVLGVATFTDRVVVPLLRWIGDEWHAGRLTIAHEHLASAAVHDVLVESMRSLARGNGAARVVVATPSGERHVLGAALAAATAAAEGWGVVYLGADLPAGEIAAAAAATESLAVAVSVVYVDDRLRILGELRTLRARLPVAVPLVVGGAGAAGLAAELVDAGIRVGTTLAELRDVLRDAPRVADRGADLDDRSHDRADHPAGAR